METDNLSVLLLHKHPEYLTPCCDLINDEWPRSETARMMSLQASCDKLPTSLILISNDKKYLIGHCKLTPLPSIPEGCFIETVVISKLLRGKKLGSYLMRQAEEYCKSVLKLKKLYLSTKGQENFYAKLGYVICEPVSIYGCRFTSSFKGAPESHTNKKSVPQIDCTPKSEIPPPPPPPMPVANVYNNNSAIRSNKTYMFKYI